MKVVSSQQMSYIESLAYRDGASESEFMEEAGTGVALVVHEFVERNDLDKHAVLLCGKGNNAGDAYVAGSHLLKLGYDVIALQLTPISQCSPLCQGNHHRFLAEGGLFREINSIEELAIPMHGVIVDGIFGTGFHGKVEEPYASIIDLANNSHVPIIAVDIPSGLNGSTGQAEGPVIQAAETAFLGLPKTGFFLREGWNTVGKLRYVDFGLGSSYVEESEADMIMVDPDFAKPLFPRVKRNRNKYSRGLVVGLAGSPSMPGAAALASWSALAGGAGIVRLLFPDGMQAELSSTPYEIIKIAYRQDDLDMVVETLNKASAAFIGPGIGRDSRARKVLDYVLPRIEKPCVIDADALTLLAEKMVPLPKQAILTPHQGEMERLLGVTSHQVLSHEFLATCQKYAEDNNITLIVKGGPSFIFQADQMIHVNSSGDPAMATAGSGDVLTGLLSALLAQGLTPHDAAILGVFLHGLAGEHAAVELTPNCVVASDILYHFPDAFKLKLL